MHFNFFHGVTKFQVMDECTIAVHASTTLAMNKMSKPEARFISTRPATTGYRGFGTFIVPRFSIIELLAYAMSYRITEDIYSFRIKFDCRETIPKLGVFPLYTNIKSLEVLELEPIQ